MVVTAKDIFQYGLIFLFIFWPVWALAFFFLRWLVLKIGLPFRNRQKAYPAVFPNIGPPIPNEKPIETV